MTGLRYLVLIFLFAATACGSDADPEPAPTFSIHIKTQARGYSDEHIAEAITEPLFRQFRDMKDLKHIETISKNGQSIIMLTFPGWVDRTKTKYDVRAGISSVYENLPANLPSQTEVHLLDESYWPRINLRIINKSYATLTFETCVLALRDKIFALSQVNNIITQNLSERYVLIELDSAKLKAFKLTPVDVELSLRGFHHTEPQLLNEPPDDYTGLVAAGNRIRIDVDSFDRSIEDHVIYLNEPVFLRDIATISFLGEKQASLCIDLQISIHNGHSFEEVSGRITEIIKNLACTDRYECKVTEIPLPGNPYDFSGIYPELEKPAIYAAGCSFTIDQEKCIERKISPVDVETKLHNLIVLYPELSAEELLRFTVLSFDPETHFNEITLKEVVVTDCNDNQEL